MNTKKSTTTTSSIIKKTSIAPGEAPLQKLTDRAQLFLDIRAAAYAGLAFTEELGRTILTTGVKIGLNHAWLYFDSLVGFLFAASMLYDDETHKRTENKVKAYLFAQSALGLIVCNVVKAGVYLSPAIIADAAINLCMTTYNALKAYKVSYLEGWLDESLTELEFLNEKINSLDEKYKRYQNETKDFGHLKFSKEVSELSDKMQTNVEQTQRLELRREKLLANIKVRTNVYCNPRIIDEWSLEKRRQAVEAVFKAHPKTEDQIQKVRNYLDREPKEGKPRVFATEPEIKQDEAIQSELNQQLSIKTSLLAVKIAAFIGITLAFALCPPAYVPLAIMAATAGVLLMKNLITYLKKPSQEPDLSMIDDAPPSPRLS